ncbi:YALIA101S04e13784g1_1 [Yarrowia lipolytica]|nr:Cullin-3 [Yarrowia lipolytica]SEI34228.1 YALIA101S04e13784g1_1 [Yarrowia lipolytica]
MKMTTQRGKIKAPRAKTSSSVSFDKSWEILASAMTKIQDHESSPLSFELLYRTSYQLVISKMSAQLYDAVKCHISAHLDKVQAGFDPYVVVARDDLSLAPKFLEGLNKQWSDHQTCTKMIGDVMMYLDRVYCLDNTSSPPKLADLGLHLFRDHVVGTGPFAEYLYKVLINEIQREREGEMVDRTVIKNVLSMLDLLPQSKSNKESVLVHCFSDQLVAATTNFYSQAARDLLDGNKDPVVYVTKVSGWLEDEEKRSKYYALESQAYSPLVSDLTVKLVSTKLPEVMALPGSEIRKWYQAKKFDELKTLYRLISKGFPQRSLLHHLLKEQIVSEGQNLNSASNSAVEAARKEKKPSAQQTALAHKWVTDVLTMRDEFAEITAKCFDNDVEVVKSIDEAFVEFVNKHARVAEYLSLYIDNLMKKALKGKSDEEVAAILDSTVACFNFITDKDRFENYYKAHLGKRLLNSKSLSDDAERQLISRFKMAAGGAFTSKFEGMFKDIATSADEMEFFRKSRASITADSEPSSAKKVELTVALLSGTYWPTSIAQGANYTLIHCADAENAKEQFEQYYSKAHSGRKLEWVPNLGNADIRIKFKKKFHDVNVPNPVMPILMLFQDVGDQSISFHRIQMETGIPIPDLKRHLQSVSVAPKTRLLKKVPMSKDVNETDEFFFNENFEAPMTKIRVLAINATRAETDVERDATMVQIDKSRQNEIDAAIVRVMKSRKTLNHNNLVGEVTKQLASRFKPPIPTIKHCIESLLEREYLRRDDNDTTLFHYEA